MTTCAEAPTAPQVQRAITYRVNRPRPETVRLWTLQPYTVWEDLCRCGHLYVDFTQIGSSFFRFPWAYGFMREQMAQRLPGYEGHYPWWAWFRPKPDLRRWHFHNYFVTGSRATRIELAIPAERVLLSNYLAWYCVLNRTCLHLNEAEFDIPKFENAAADEAAWKDTLDPELQWPLSAPWHYRVVPSWEHIFNLKAMEEWAGDAVQATFERLELADVVAVTEFTAREVWWE